ncbi:hypothetical protein [Nocardia sp. CA-120079]|uniref:hypothetical protein n=1 Tax=Nocardia sp. CA-120079 TaxID=3239974 RepID=UPI003D98D7E7
MESVPPVDDCGDADQVVALVVELREAWGRYRGLSHQLRPGGAGGPAMQATDPTLLRLSREADRQRPYLLAAADRWQDYESVDEHVETLLGQYDRTVARIRQARTDGRDGLADALQRSLPRFQSEITRAAGECVDAVTTAYGAAEQVYQQAGPDGVVTRSRVDAVALEAVDTDRTARMQALTRFQHAEQVLFRAGWTVEGARDQEGILRIRPTSSDATGARIAAVRTGLGQAEQLAEQQPAPAVLRLRAANMPVRHMRAVPHQDQGLELER